MKLKHIKLFENFDEQMPQENSNMGIDPSLIFDWMPYDSMVNDAIQGSIPKELTYQELVPFLDKSSQEGKVEAIKEAGLFIAHNKLGNGGFSRSIITNLSPISYDFAIFNSNYEMTNEYKDINPGDIDIKGLIKGSAILNRYKS
jgi:hypothetical protein